MIAGVGQWLKPAVILLLVMGGSVVVMIIPPVTQPASAQPMPIVPMTGIPALFHCYANRGF